MMTDDTQCEALDPFSYSVRCSNRFEARPGKRFCSRTCQNRVTPEHWPRPTFWPYKLLGRVGPELSRLLGELNQARS